MNTIDDFSILVKKQTLIEVYNLLYSIKVKGDAVGKIAYIEQLLLGLVNNKDNDATSKQ